MYQIGGTIKEVLDSVHQNKFVLPAIQREFVWKPEQIARLFDSLMQGYPFGTFLFWKVNKQNCSKYKFYSFVRDYHERDNPHCPQLPIFHETELTAVLDGQQRLTALNIGLSGSMAWRIPYKWKTSPDAYPVRHLYLDLLAESVEDDETGERYRFEFLTEKRVSEAGPGECWFKVSEILGMQAGPAMLEWLQNRLPHESTLPAYTTLHEFYRVVHDKHLISYYEEPSQNLEKVLNIFIRMNSGGTKLSYSDLLLSVAVAQWQGDARKEIHTLVDELNNTGEGFNFSKDLVLKAGLMLADIGSVGFKVENFNHANMAILEKRWPDVKRSLKVAVQLLASFGFNEKTLRADSALLPIAYYIGHRNLDGKYVSSSTYRDDRQAIRTWLIRSLLKTSGIWGSGLDTLLTALRETIKKEGDDAFPVAKLQEVMAKRGKSLQFSEEEIDTLAEMQYGDKRVFALLTLLFPFVDVTNHHFHIDHVFPKSRFTKTRFKYVRLPEEEWDELKEMGNSLPNLQLLDGPENLEKKAVTPANWMETAFTDDTDRSHYCKIHVLGTVPPTLREFREFYDVRAAALRHKIVDLLGVSKEAAE
ncbi:DUF262 domain-containing protein [Allorhodopirellula heiligendammensis]|uniref:GmrSD restriction endonucleases N-terminal domain-containing protein n=1 Tax=Allorhodopirellula heiligendammensis TaxID=2714739 RepID=A0A5C6BCK7_9BACT|nr:DUF262 domain-containing protein [Allorhodopirellula heiligendammensis]TWU09955.1 hypothetical protein Poly21_52840 [Allorhodopirellula heiligendammensis]